MDLQWPVDHFDVGRSLWPRHQGAVSRKEYKKQRNFCVNLLKRAKKEHFANLDINCISDNKKFWQTVKPLFSNKVKSKTTIKLVENDKMIDDETKLQKYLTNIS